MNTFGRRPKILAKALACAAMFAGGVLLAGNAPATHPSTAPATSPHHMMGMHGPATTMAAPPTAAPAATRTAEQKKQDDIDLVMNFLKRTQPDVYDTACALRTNDPAKFDKLILDLLPNVTQWEEMRQSKPELFELSMKNLELGYQSLRLAHDLKRTDLSETDRKQMIVQLKMIVSHEFEIQQRIRQFEINELQAKVKELDSKVKGRDSGKDAIIQKRMEDLTQGQPRLEW